MATTDLNLKDSLVESGKRYRKEILLMTTVALQASLQFMTLRKGIRGTEAVGSLSSNAQLRPYRTAKDATNTAAIDARELNTYLGDVVEEFDPYLIYTTIYGEPVGKTRISLDIVKKLAVSMAKMVVEKLDYALFTAVRSANGDTTQDLFNGFDTIIKKEKITKVASTDTEYPISTDKGNLVVLEDLTSSNIGDELLKLYRGMHDVMKNKKVLMFVPFSIKEMYDDWHAANYGTANFAGAQYEQTVLRGSNNSCQIVPLVSMKDATHIIITTKKNMLVGVDQLSDTERVEINKCDNPKVVQFFMTMFFGVEFESISEREFCCAEITYPDPEEETSSSDNSSSESSSSESSNSGSN